MKSPEDGWRNVARGRWGETAAARFLEGKGWKIVGRNVRPCATDRRCEIDIVARSRKGDMVAFVEVKMHGVRTEGSVRLEGVDRRKKRNLLRACAGWLMKNRWHGNYRFDVVEVWGSEADGTPPEIDHVENVPLFGPNWRFW